jgi:hypothetical protein
LRGAVCCGACEKPRSQERSAHRQPLCGESRFGSQGSGPLLNCARIFHGD